MPTKAELHQAAKDAATKTTRAITAQITISIPIGCKYTNSEIVDMFLKIKSVIPEIKVLGAVSND